MAKTPSLEELARRVASALGSRLVSFVLYGSAARGEQAPGGDVDTLLICDAADEALFDALEPIVAAWVRAGQPAPLVFTEHEWTESVDAFAIEYGDMRDAYRVLAGRDPWPGIVVDRAHARRQLEQELRGKVLRLRQGYLAARADGRALETLVRGTTGGWLTMLRAALRLAGRPVPAEVAAVVRAAAAVAGFEPEPVGWLVEAARGAGRLGLAARDPRAAAYLAAVARTAEYVNTL